MRATAAVIILSLGAVPAFAGTVTDTIAFSGGSDNGLPTINGPAFNPALGTLTNVSVTLAGTYDPMIFTTVSNAPAQSLLQADLNLLGNGSQPSFLTAGSFKLTQVGNYLEGPPEAFSFTESVNTAAALYEYTGGPGNAMLGLASYDVFSNPAVAGGWGSMADDVSKFSGQFAITYTYSVAEPGSLTVLMGGLAGLGLALGVLRGRRWGDVRLSQRRG